MERILAGVLGAGVALAVCGGVLAFRAGVMFPPYLEIPLFLIGAAVAIGGVVLWWRDMQHPPLASEVEAIPGAPPKARTFSGLGPLTGLRIFVTDLERARTYYRDKVGLIETSHTPPVATFASGQVNIVVEQVDPADPESKTSVGRYVGATFATENAQATHDLLKERGVEWLEPPEKQYWGGIMAHFRDPDGNVLTILQLPARG